MSCSSEIQVQGPPPPALLRDAIIVILFSLPSSGLSPFFGVLYVLKLQSVLCTSGDLISGALLPHSTCVSQTILIPDSKMFERRRKQYPYYSVCGPRGGDSVYYLFEKY
jgi:hypothetical protein